MTVTLKAKVQHYSQELSAYTLGQFCEANALLNNKLEDAITLGSVSQHLSG